MRAKPARVQLVWRDGQPPRVQGVVEDPTQPERAIVVGSAAWFAWLQTPTTQSFAYPVYDHAHGYIAGFMTVRQERRQRGQAYWVAYRRCQGCVRKRYLGASAALSAAHLDAVAQLFLAAGHRHAQTEETDGSFQ